MSPAMEEKFLVYDQLLIQEKVLYVTGIPHGNAYIVTLINQIKLPFLGFFNFMFY